MFEVDVKNVTEGRREGGGGDQLGFGVLMTNATKKILLLLLFVRSFISFQINYIKYY